MRKPSSAEGIHGLPTCFQPDATSSQPEERIFGGLGLVRIDPCPRVESPQVTGEELDPHLFW